MLRPSDRGAVTISLAILFPTVLFIVLMVVQASLWWYASQAAVAAAREGVEAGRVRGATLADGDARVGEFLGRFDNLARPVRVSHDGSDADSVEYVVEVRTQSVLPFVDGRTIVRTARAPRERFTAPGGTP
ncbi:TadE/TadG family type IV pilus assembly protein [Kitasatospora sp. NPDC048540]|uniref:TadE/TadG family type IV pilus assembly protein n=1 Tax=unclassified Kitasatospora TaxID=2633591 RepID=UPI001314C3D3|nr:TadE/TadG family type IV pilus assembly protein [Kitasatospora sp. MBT63]